MNIALIFAGGSGQRMRGSAIPKQFIEVNGKPIIIHAILNFERHDEIDGIAVVCIESWSDELKEIIKRENITKVKWLVSGARTGQQSIYNGLKAVYDTVGNPEETIVLISDGVRPIVSEKIISDNISCVKKHGSSATIFPVPETILELDESGRVINIPVRKRCFLSKAPQGFWLSEIMEAHNKAVSENRFDCTNSVELMYRYGHSVFTVADSDENIKITTPLDMRIYETILNSNNNI
jgi:2-C-methyl-D-erythritol 4-phosphate cytidylyltransferase